MSHLVTRALVDDATVWTVSPDGFGGDTFAAPVTVKCRWEDRTEEYFSQLDQNQQVSRSIVFLAQSASVGDYLFQGISAALDPTVVAGAYKIRRFDKVPNLRNLLVQRKAYL